MPDHRSLSLYDVADKLNIGETTLNVWRKRYNKWMPHAVDTEGRLFPEDIVDAFRFISKCIHAGMEPHEIECALDSKRASSKSDHGDSSSNAGRFDQTQAVLSALTDTFSGIVGQQQRIADAQERRAMAEERKAYALESQAEAELIKANALRDIVSLFQDMTVKDSVSALMEKVKNMPGPSFGELEDFTMDMGYSPEQLEDLPEIVDIHDPESFEDVGEITDLHPEENDNTEPSRDDAQDSFRDHDIDDLSQLIEREAVVDRVESVDDLSFLLEPEDHLSGGDIDDLSLLVDDIDKVAGGPEKTETVMTVDDLSKLLEPDDIPPAQIPVKDQPHPAKVDEGYKSKILKRIIQMKQQEKLSIEDVTRRFNDEGVKTLSGKGKWDSKTIQGIYKYIDSVQGG